MDLSSVDLATLQVWQTQALNTFASVQNGGRISSASYGQGNGSKAVTFAVTTIDDLRQWLALLGNEIARRTGVYPRTRRRAIGLRFG